MLYVALSDHISYILQKVSNTLKYNREKKQKYRK